jgi:phage-related protein
LVQGIINSLPTLITEGPRIINDFADAIWGAVGTIITTGANLIVELAKGLLQSLPLIKENAGEILMAIINVMSLSKMVSLGKSLMTNMANGIKGMLSSIKTAGKNVLQNLVNGIKALAKNPVSALKNIGNNAMKAFKSLSWAGIGKAVIQGIANGIKNGVSTIISAAKTAARKALDAAKNALGIKSPSRVFRDEVGKMMAKGMGIGFEDNVPTEDMMEKIRESVKHMQKKAGEISQTVLVNASNKFNERFIVNGDRDDSKSDPDESILQITNIFEVDGTKLEERTVNATIKKMNNKQKDANAWKGAK